MFKGTPCSLLCCLAAHAALRAPSKHTHLVPCRSQQSLSAAPAVAAEAGGAVQQLRLPQRLVLSLCLNFGHQQCANSWAGVSSAGQMHGSLSQLVGESCANEQTRGDVGNVWVHISLDGSAPLLPLAACSCGLSQREPLS